MKKKTIWSHTIVHNEENFIWFALMSVVDFVDKMMVWDTGSTDDTVKIIEEVKKIKGDKIEFRQVGETSPEQFTLMRQKMLEESRCDWILILDGDEVWWEDSIRKVIEIIKESRNSLEGIVVPMIVAVGDIYHFQEESAGQYKILGRKGHLSLRAINKKIPGLHVGLPYGSEGYYDIHNNLIHAKKEIIFLNNPYLHLSHLRRSGLEDGKRKFKYELGKSFPANFKYPEVLYKSCPEIVSSVWKKMERVDYFKSLVLTPLKWMKRKIIN